MTFVISLGIALALTWLVTRRRKRRIRRAAKWLWTHPATTILAVVFGYSWHRVGFNWALVAAVGYTTVVVVGRFWWRRTQSGYTAHQRVDEMRYRKQPIHRSLRVAVFKRDGFVCVYCGDHRYLSADHIVPESKGGLATLENLQTLCRSCNSTKGPNGPVIPVPRSAQQGTHPDPWKAAG